MNKKKPFVVERRYLGHLDVPAWKQWHRWERSYESKENAQAAIAQLVRNPWLENFEFRVVEKHTKHEQPPISDDSF